MRQILATESMYVHELAALHDHGADIVCIILEVVEALVDLPGIQWDGL